MQPAEKLLDLLMMDDCGGDWAEVRYGQRKLLYSSTGWVVMETKSPRSSWKTVGVFKDLGKAIYELRRES